MKYIDRVAPIRIGAKFKMRETFSFIGITWTIVGTRPHRFKPKITMYILKAGNMNNAATIARTHEDLRSEFEYIFPWEYITNYPKEDI
jgi:hypothetical protein